MLGVPHSATDREITDAYRLLAQLYHPDTLAGRPESVRRTAERRMQELNEAYKLLRDRRRTRMHEEPAEDDSSVTVENDAPTQTPEEPVTPVNAEVHSSPTRWWRYLVPPVVVALAVGTFAVTRISDETVDATGSASA